jgi:gamma-glutamylcyclotransferase (GGCT)/AIG2-like uncharacterized protein YtfP
MKLLFVYGNLMQYESSSEKISNGVFIGDSTLNGFDMYNCGRLPGIIEGESQIKGELYEIDDLLEREIDSFEGYLENDNSTYSKIQVSVTCNNKIYNDVYVYVLNSVKGYTKINSGDWRIK